MLFATKAMGKDIASDLLLWSEGDDWPGAQNDSQAATGCASKYTALLDFGVKSLI